MHQVMHDPLLQTKLHRPELSRELILRPRLLNELRAPASLVLVIAPAGYGKTTLLVSWLNTTPTPSAWLALDDADNDFSTFVHYLVAAVQTCFPEIGARTTRLIQDAAPGFLPAISRSLLQELTSIDQEFILVLDDYHLIHNKAIHSLLADVLRHPPSSLHLVLAARNDPALPLPGLRARGLVTELRAADLGFSLEETARFFREALKMELSDGEIAVLNEKSEGWAAALRLAAVHFKHSAGSSVIEASQRGGNRYLFDYLVNEVTVHLPEDVRSFLMKTSILEQLSAPLCEAVLGHSGGQGEAQEKLNWLVESGLFTTPVQNAPEWYRYHHVFRQFLARELEISLPREEIAALHLRASGWFEGRGLLTRAISHAFAAGDAKTAVNILVRNRRELTNRDDWTRMQQLLKLYPRNIIGENLELKLAEASVLLFQARHPQVAALLDEVEISLGKSRLKPADRRRLEGEVASGRAAIQYWAGDLAGSTTAAELALERLPRDWQQPRLQARLFLGLCLQTQGELGRAFETLQDSSEASPESGSIGRRMIQACFLDWLAADLNGVERAAFATLERNRQGAGPSQAHNWANHFLGVVQYERNDLASAERYLSPLVTHPDQVHGVCFLNSTAALALLYQHRGQPERALELVEALLLFALESDTPLATEIGTALRADISLQQGKLDEAVLWAERYRWAGGTRLPYFYAPPIVCAKVLIAQDTPPSRRRAARTLSSLKRTFVAEHQPRWLISVLGLEAMLLRKQGNETKALAELARAIALAEPGGFVRPFVDLGRPLKPLLETLRHKLPSSAYLERVISAFEAEASPAGPGRARGTRAGSASKPGLELTQRELEVLLLLKKRYSDKEIAEALVISKETVHSHIAHLGGKLDARGRRSIVQAAEELGLLT